MRDLRFKLQKELSPTARVVSGNTSKASQLGFGCVRPQAFIDLSWPNPGCAQQVVCRFPIPGVKPISSIGDGLETASACHHTMLAAAWPLSPWLSFCDGTLKESSLEVLARANVLRRTHRALSHHLPPSLPPRLLAGGAGLDLQSVRRADTRRGLPAAGPRHGRPRGLRTAPPRELSRRRCRRRR